MGFDGFRIVWRLAEIAAIVVLTGPLCGLLFFFSPLRLEVAGGNIHELMALAIVVGFRWPALWAFMLLTKVTPGVGILWFAVRREWRRLAIAVGVTVAIALASFAFAPGLWFAWLSNVGGDASPEGFVLAPLPLRVVAAAVLVAWGALTDRKWTVLVAAFVALPVSWVTGLGMLIGLPALAKQSSPPHASDS